MADYSTDFEALIRTHLGKNVIVWLTNGPQVSGIVDSFGPDCVVIKPAKRVPGDLREQTVVKLDKIIAVEQQMPH